MLVFSNPLIFNLCSYSWEVETVNPNLVTDTFDVAVILGGVASLDKVNNVIQFASNSDRFLNVLPLYFDGRVKKILISGGSGTLNQDQVESTLLKGYLIQIGIDPLDIITESRSRNTYENAKYSAEILKTGFSFKKILLSTSATHMRRSNACFVKQGVNCFQYSVDKTNSLKKISFSNILMPNPEIFNKWYWLLHEWLGMIVYQIKGYI